MKKAKSQELKSHSFKTYLQSLGQSEQTIAGMYKHLTEFLNWTEDQRIASEQATYPDLLAYIKHLQKREIKQRTTQIYLNSLKHYFDWLVKREEREDNPTRNIKIRGIKKKHLYDILSKQELESLYESYQVEVAEGIQTQIQQRNKVIIGLMIWQGAGTLELHHLKNEALHLREGKIRLAATRKTNERTLKLEAQQVLDVMEYQLKTREALLKHYQKESEQLIISQGKSMLNVMNLLIKKLHKQNSKVTSSKQIRASVITHWLKNYNLREVQYKAGHRYVSSTESYLINDLDDLQEDITKYHPF